MVASLSYESDRTYTSREAADLLGFDRFSETNRYARLLESVGYVIRTNSLGRRLYTEKDIAFISEIRKYSYTRVRLDVIAKYIIDPDILSEDELLDIKLAFQTTHKIKDIADRLGIPFPNVVRYANYLEEEGYVVQRDRNGRRMYTDELVNLLTKMQGEHLGGLEVKQAAKLIVNKHKEGDLNG